MSSNPSVARLSLRAFVDAASRAGLPCRELTSVGTKSEPNSWRVCKRWRRPPPPWMRTRGLRRVDGEARTSDDKAPERTEKGPVHAPTAQQDGGGRAGCECSRRDRRAGPRCGSVATRWRGARRLVRGGRASGRARGSSTTQRQGAQRRRVEHACGSAERHRVLVGGDRRRRLCVWRRAVLRLAAPNRDPRQEHRRHRFDADGARVLAGRFRRRRLQLRRCRLRRIDGWAVARRADSGDRRHPARRTPRCHWTPRCPGQYRRAGHTGRHRGDRQHRRAGLPGGDR